MIRCTITVAAVIAGASALGQAADETTSGTVQDVRPKRGDVVFESRFEAAEKREAWSQAPWARWVEVQGRGTCLRMSVSPETVEKARQPTEVGGQ